jgi:ABC-type lipoprotein export system ATPase subunit
VDDETADEILNHLMNFRKEKEVTLVIASHGNIPEKYADTIYTIESGRLKN